MPSLDDSSFINDLDPRLAQPFLDGFAQSVDTVLLLAAFIMVFGVILTVMLPELPLRNVSGIQGRFDDDAAARCRSGRRPRSAGSPRSSPTRPPWTARSAHRGSTGTLELVPRPVNLDGPGTVTQVSAPPGPSRRSRCPRLHRAPPTPATAAWTGGRCSSGPVW